MKRSSPVPLVVQSQAKVALPPAVMFCGDARSQAQLADAVPDRLTGATVAVTVLMASLLVSTMESAISLPLVSDVGLAVRVLPVEGPAGAL